tara:strand:+ start:40 stop:405 length:366 start_codon:yes stop_codon:yes gene_type:complete
MKVKPTFFNSRRDRLHWDYEDTNNWLFKIIYRIGTTCKEQNYILRDLKQDKSIIGYIYKKIHQRFDVIEIEVDRFTKTEYDMAINIGVPTVLNCVKTKPLYRTKLRKAKTNSRKNHQLQEV